MKTEWSSHQWDPNHQIHQRKGPSQPIPIYHSSSTARWERYHLQHHRPGYRKRTTNAFGERESQKCPTSPTMTINRTGNDVLRHLALRRPVESVIQQQRQKLEQVLTSRSSRKVKTFSCHRTFRTAFLLFVVVFSPVGLTFAAKNEKESFGEYSVCNLENWVVRWRWLLNQS